MLIVGFIVLVITLTAAQVGFIVGRRLRPRLDDAAIGEQHAIEAGVLGLMALLLGFTFAMAEERFETRKQLVIEEANAIGTASLRTRAVAGPEGAEIRSLLRAYVDRRLANYRRWHSSPEEELSLSSEVELRAWPLAAGLAQADPRSVPVGLLLTSLNEVIDLNAKRVEALTNHVPMAVLIALLLMAVVAMGWMGLGLALSGRHSIGTMLILSFVIAVIAAVIVDLDQPRLGLIRVSQAALERLRPSL
jgi:hypothetical protein